MGSDAPHDGTVRRIVQAAFDIAVTLDEDDEVEEITVVPGFPHRVPPAWTRASFHDLLTSETKAKARDLIQRARQEGSSPARQLNLSFPGNVELPVDFSAVGVEGTEKVLALGTSLQGVAEMQQRLVRAQQDMEREYWQYRHAETRYQALFALSGEPIFLVDWGSLEILQANEAAAAWTGRESQEELEGHDVCATLSPGAPDSVRTLFELYRSGDTRGPLHFQTESGSQEVHLRAVESGNRRAILTRLVGGPQAEGAETRRDTRRRPDMDSVAVALPDGVCVLDEAGAVRWANPAFLELVQLEPAELSDGPKLTRWLQGPGSGAGVLLSTLADRQSVRLYRSTLTGSLGLETDVEISGAHLDSGGWVLTFRAVAPRLQSAAADGTSLGTRVSELSGLLGTVGLKELVGSVGELVERHLISAALEATGGNRTAAAELLMLSRQTLYTKLRELGLDSDDGE